MSAMQCLLVLGATGSIGSSTLDVAARHPQRLRVWGLTANTDVDALVALCRQHRPMHAAIADAGLFPRLREGLKAAGLSTIPHGGAAALAELAAHPEVDQVMAAITGAAGLLPTLAALRAGKRVLIANKEPLVMCGGLMLAAASASGATVLPIDSEHNAIFQCLPATMRCGAAVPRGVRKLILTASGGPFRDTPLTDFDAITPEQAVRHPNWSMGRKISVDSATMMNKGLELIEAAVLYGVGSERIDVVLHPESVIHSMVEYDDGSTLAQLGQPDMRTPIAHALAWPERWHAGVDGLDWMQTRQLRFVPVEAARYPALGLARAALEAGGVMPNVLNAANEVAVEAFLSRRLGFTGIARLVEAVLDRAAAADLPPATELSAVLAVDAWARERAAAVLAG